MKIRRFFAKDMRTGLKEISREMGPEAAILSTNNVTGGIEIVAATDYEEALKVSKQARTPILPSAKERQAQLELTQSKLNNEVNANVDITHKSSPLSELRNEFFEHQKQLKKSENSLDNNKNNIINNKTTKISSRGKRSFATSTESTIPSKNLDWGSDPVISKIHDELKLLSGLVQSQLAQSDWSRSQTKQPVESEIIHRLVNLGMPVQLAQHYAQDTENCQLDDAWYRVAATIAHDIPISSDNIINDGGCYALIGPTGVGKTTTVAKLAAMAVKKHGSQAVALISTDSYRIAAHEQLAIYAQIMGVEVLSVSDGEQLDNAIKSFNDKKLILIDTAGIGQRDQRLAEQLDCLDSSLQSIKHLLVLSATSQLANLHESVKRFGQFRLQGAILTKLDEATSLGVLLATVIRSQLPLYYVTDGQNVPDDIQSAKAHQLVTEAISLANEYPQESAEQWRIAQALKRVG